MVKDDTLLVLGGIGIAAYAAWKLGGGVSKVGEGAGNAVLGTGNAIGDFAGNIGAGLSTPFNALANAGDILDACAGFAVQTIQQAQDRKLRQSQAASAYDVQIGDTQGYNQAQREQIVQEAETSALRSTANNFTENVDRVNQLDNYIIDAGKSAVSSIRNVVSNASSSVRNVVSSINSIASYSAPAVAAKTTAALVSNVAQNVAAAQKSAVATTASLVSKGVSAVVTAEKKAAGVVSSVVSKAVSAVKSVAGKLRK